MEKKELERLERIEEKLDILFDLIKGKLTTGVYTSGNTGRLTLEHITNPVIRTDEKEDVEVEYWEEIDIQNWEEIRAELGKMIWRIRYYSGEDYYYEKVGKTLESFVKKILKEKEEYGYRRGCIDTCEIYEDCKGEKGETLRFWKEKQIKLKDNK